MAKKKKTKSKPHIPTLSAEKKRTRKIAKELFYPKEVLERIDNARSRTELVSIMESARKKEEERC